MLTNAVLLAALASGAFAQIAVWTPGMYCRGGNNSAVDDQDTNLVVNPLYQLPKSKWWMQSDRGCDVVPPAAGESLALPAGGTFEVEMAENRAFTTLSHNGERVTDWTDGKTRSEPWHGPLDGGPGCLVDNPDGLGGPLHTQSQERATGTAFAISYNSNIADVNMENLVVFTVLKNTPWKRKAVYDVPKNFLLVLPAAATVPGCGSLMDAANKTCTSNLSKNASAFIFPVKYMQNFKCHVTGSTSTKKLGKAKPPVYCADDASKCAKGPKQMIVWHQAEGNNVFPPNDVTPPYNLKMGFSPGAQNDIFEDTLSTSPTKLGSYTDTSSPRIFPTSIQIPEGNTNLTPERCISACKSAGYTYAGVEYMTECWCGNSAPPSGLKIADSECDLPCAGDSSKTCGAA